VIHGRVPGVGVGGFVTYQALSLVDRLLGVVMQDSEA
jgi:hypothetical protein